MSAVNSKTRKKGSKSLVIVLIILLPLTLGVVGMIILGKISKGNLFTETISIPIGDANALKVLLDPDDGNLSIDGQTTDQKSLMTGTLQYFEKHGPPTWSMDTDQGRATLQVESRGGQFWERLPWAPRNGGINWQVHLNPDLLTDLIVTSGGGNIELNLLEMSVARVSAETGGGNLLVSLPAGLENTDTSLMTGAGKVTVKVGKGLRGFNKVNASSGMGEINIILPGDIATRILLASGNIEIDPRFIKINDTTYQTPDYETAVDQLEITVETGAGSVKINLK